MQHVIFIVRQILHVDMQISFVPLITHADSIATNKTPADLQPLKEKEAVSWILIVEYPNHVPLQIFIVQQMVCPPFNDQLRTHPVNLLRIQDRRNF